MKKIIEYKLRYGRYRLKFLNIGAAITEYSIDNTNVVLAYEDLESYRKNDICLGVVVGRTAGRIREGKLSNWQLPLNENGKHNLHGNQLHRRFYEVEIIGCKAILTLHDKEGDFPGNADIKIVYELTKTGLKQTIDCSSDKSTIFNMTNHSYFNLGQNTVLSHELRIDADSYLSLDIDNLPIEKKSVKKSVFDFTNWKLIAAAKLKSEPQFAYTKFLNHPYKLDGSIYLRADNISLEVKTDCEYAVIYTGNYLSNCTSKIIDNRNNDYSGICIETQAAPGTIDLSSTYKSVTFYNLNSN